jgi:hypothetical protein
MYLRIEDPEHDVVGLTSSTTASLLTANRMADRFGQTHVNDLTITSKDVFDP